MFPPSLHKNIRELDKQIALLESECENMETEERKRGINPKIYFPKSKEPVTCKKVKEHVERPFVTGPRISDVKKNFKASSVTKLCQKNSVNSVKKQATNRETSTSTSDEPRYNKKYIRNCPICGSIRERTESGNKDKKNQGVTKCICGKELLNEFNQNEDSCETDNEKHVLHKGILHANPGGTIEVTVTQKASKIPSNTDKVCHIKTVSSVRGMEKGNAESSLIKENQNPSAGKLKLKKTPGGQKWSEILCQDNVNHANTRTGVRNTVKSAYSLSSKFFNQCETEPIKYALIGDTYVNVPYLNLDKEIVSQVWNDENECPDAHISSQPKKLRQNSPLTRKNLENVVDASPRAERSFEEKNVHSSDEIEKSQISEESFDHLGTLFTVIEALKGKFSEEETKRLLSELEMSLKKLNEETEKDKMDESNICSQDNKKFQKHFLSTKKLRERLMKQNKLSEELAVKDRLLSNMISKEKEYLKIITDLKVNLEKKRAQAEDNMEVLKELNITKNKLLNETKVADALRKSHAKMQEQIQKCMLENDKLKTEIRLNKLESQKFCVLLAGKDAEIKRYKDEVESFQRQITDQLAALRSNNAANEVQKAMEAIIQQSQAFSVTDLDSAFSEGQTEEKITPSKSKQRDKLMHSSPTSTKSSLSECSWNHISSIHDEDTKDNIVLNETENEVLIGDLQQAQNGVATPTENERGLSFTSCKSVNLSLTRSNEPAPMMECKTLGLKLGDDNKNLRRKIEELFEDLKEKCSKRILSIPSDSVIFDDLFMSSGTSDLSEISASFFGIEEENNKR